MNLDNIFGCVFSVGRLRQKIWTAAIEFVQSQGQSVFRLDAPEHTPSAGAGEKAEEIRRSDPREYGNRTFDRIAYRIQELQQLNQTVLPVAAAAILATRQPLRL
jgi:hypothetical protein